MTIFAQACALSKIFMDDCSELSFCLETEYSWKYSRRLLIKPLTIKNSECVASVFLLLDCPGQLARRSYELRE